MKEEELLLIGKIGKDTNDDNYKQILCVIKTKEEEDFDKLKTSEKMEKFNQCFNENKEKIQ